MRVNDRGEHVLSEHHAAWARAVGVLIGRQKASPIAGSTASKRHLSLSLLWQAMQLHAPALASA